MINHTLISSVINPYKLNFSARVITYSVNNETSSYTTSDNISFFLFRNNNWNYVKSNQKTYLVIDKMSIFMFEFEDSEKDRILLIVNDMVNISYFIQSVNKTSNVFNILLNANSTSDEIVQLVIQYTDIYHQDLTQYQKLVFSLNIFLVEPPVFASELQSININRCSPYQYYFPSIIDENNYSWDIILNENNPPWITINRIDKYLVFDGSNKNYNIPSTNVVPIKLVNEMKAFTLYNITINVIQTRELIFDFVSDIMISCWKIF